jgi:hypothetical protein
MRVQRWRAGIAVVSAFAISFSTSAARADDTANDARAAYNEGLAAHENGDEKTAARDFARADAILPSNEALEAAAASALRADDAILGMTLVERASSRDLDARATDTIERARRAFAPRVTTFVIDCGSATECTASIDDAAFVDAHVSLMALSGKHAIAILRDKNRQFVNVVGGGGQVVRIAEQPRDAAPHRSQARESSSSITLPIAYAAIGVTLALGGFSIASGIDAKSKRSDFENGNCGTDAASSTSPISNCNQLASSGQSAQLRTNLLVAGTAVAVVGTLAFIVVAKPFGSRSNVAVSASIGGVSGALTF